MPSINKITNIENLVLNIIYSDKAVTFGSKFVE